MVRLLQQWCHQVVALTALPAQATALLPRACAPWWESLPTCSKDLQGTAAPVRFSGRSRALLLRLQMHWCRFSEPALRSLHQHVLCWLWLLMSCAKFVRSPQRLEHPDMDQLSRYGCL